MTWLLLTGAGFLAETAVIVALGRTTTARYDAERSGRSTGLRDDQVARDEKIGAVRPAHG